MTDSVSNRPSAGEEAAAAARRADQTRVKKTESSAIQQGAQGKKGGGSTKELKSTFDDVLSKMSETPTTALPQEAKFDSRLKEVQRDQEHSSSDRDSDDEKKPKEKSEGSKKTKDPSDIGRERVMAKHEGGGQKQQDSGKGSGDGKGEQKGGGFQQKSQAQLAQDQSQTEELRRLQQGQANVPAPGLTPAQLQNVNPEVVALEAPKELPKAMLQQIISHVRLGVDKNLNKMMEIDLHDEVFQGLQLRVTSHGKEVSVEFIAPNRSVKDCFMQEREKIAMALGEKGVEVRDIMVTMR